MSELPEGLDVAYEPPSSGRIRFTIPLANGMVRGKTWENRWRGDVAALRHTADLIERTARDNGWED